MKIVFRIENMLSFYSFFAYVNKSKMLMWALVWVVSYAHPENFKKRYARPAPPIPISSMSSLLALLFIIDE